MIVSEDVPDDLASSDLSVVDLSVVGLSEVDLSAVDLSIVVCGAEGKLLLGSVTLNSTLVAADLFAGNNGPFHLRIKLDCSFT